MSHTSDSTEQNTILTDTTLQSISIDTTYIFHLDSADCTFPDKITTTDDSCLHTTYTPAIEIHNGLEAADIRHDAPINDVGIFALFGFELILFLLLIHHRKKIFSWQNEGDSLYSHNRNKHLSNINSYIRNSFLLYTFLIEGNLCSIAFYTLGIPALTQRGYAVDTLLLSLPFALYFVLQQGIYLLLSAIFSPDTRGREWCGSHIVINLYLGIALFPLVPLSVYIPEINLATLWLWGTLYISSRILFIAKGIKLFLQDFRGLLYFILYLCALETAPILLIMAYTGLL